MLSVEVLYQKGPVTRPLGDFGPKVWSSHLAKRRCKLWSTEASSFSTQLPHDMISHARSQNIAFSHPALGSNITPFTPGTSVSLIHATLPPCGDSACVGALFFITIMVLNNRPAQWQERVRFRDFFREAPMLMLVTTSPEDKASAKYDSLWPLLTTSLPRREKGIMPLSQAGRWPMAARTGAWLMLARMLTLFMPG